jgi:CyaY protein
MTHVAEAVFEERADQELHRLVEALIELEELDPDLASGVLSIAFDDGTKYIVNSHRAARQIWMAADRRAWHFDLDTATDRWVAGTSGDELWGALEQVLGSKLGQTVVLSR